MKFERQNWATLSALVLAVAMLLPVEARAGYYYSTGFSSGIGVGGYGYGAGPSYGPGAGFYGNPALRNRQGVPPYAGLGTNGAAFVPPLRAGLAGPGGVGLRPVQPIYGGGIGGGAIGGGGFVAGGVAVGGGVHGGAFVPPLNQGIAGGGFVAGGAVGGGFAVGGGGFVGGACGVCGGGGAFYSERFVVRRTLFGGYKMKHVIRGYGGFGRGGYWG